MRFPKPARWALGIILVLAALKGGCEIGEEILDAALKPHHHDTPDSVASSRNQSNPARVTRQVGRGSRVYTGEPREKALAFLRDNYAKLGLKQSLDDLNIVDARSNPLSTNVELQQVFKGLPVENARLQVNFDKDGHVVQVVNSYLPPVKTSEQISISKEQAINFARQEFSRTTPVYKSKVDVQEQTNAVYIEAQDIQLAAPPKIDDVYFVQKDQLHRAYRTRIQAVRPFGIKEIITDAGRGETLQIRDSVYSSVDGRGQVFIPNPVNSLKNDKLRDLFDSNTAIPSASPSVYQTVALKELDAPGEGPFRLKGPYVELVDIQDLHLVNSPPTVTSVPDFMYERKSDEFEDVMVYYHIDRMQRYIQTLGFMNIVNHPIRADAHGCDGADNSQYVGLPTGNGFLAFGDGGVDDAEDADVIAHEYGHAIQDSQSLGRYEVTTIETRAMAEGFGDYWALSTYKRENDLNGYDLPCLMEWDHPPGQTHNCLRRGDSAKTKEQLSASASVYENGEIWSSTLYDIFTKLGKETADKIILQSHFNIPLGPNFEQGADCIITAALQLNEDDKVPDLCAVFQRHKIYEANFCPAITLPTT